MLKNPIIKKINKFHVSWHDFVNTAYNWLAAVLRFYQRQSLKIIVDTEFYVGDIICHIYSMVT